MIKFRVRIRENVKEFAKYLCKKKGMSMSELITMSVVCGFPPRDMLPIKSKAPWKEVCATGTNAERALKLTEEEARHMSYSKGEIVSRAIMYAAMRYYIYSNKEQQLEILEEAKRCKLDHYFVDLQRR